MWSSSLAASTLEPRNQTNISGVLSSFASFNIDIIAGFGYLFASNLQAAISENTVQVYADTTLYGMSGTPILFRNTSLVK